jgi:hypothetical protein
VAPPSDPSPSRRTERSAVAWFFTDPDTGKLVVAQWPNPSLAIYLVATAVRSLAHPEGTAGTALTVVGTTAILWWSVLEIARGDSPFRRVLGAAVLAVTAAGLVVR